MSAVDKAMGWIVAVWLLIAVCSDEYAPYMCMAGAMVSVVIWVYLRQFVNQD